MAGAPVVEHLVEAAGALHSGPAIARIHIAILWAPGRVTLCLTLRPSCNAWRILPISADASALPC